ncbi:unnamed protein product [Mytilus edulis]|uniref:Uncharacterized protein n=1 Tax=Mytilus edulis TaxID=6550 RepID=A0A8S3QP35_MYTED|nr:unnamed protein product [Mytilus edulis]
MILSFLLQRNYTCTKESIKYYEVEYVKTTHESSQTLSVPWTLSCPLSESDSCDGEHCGSVISMPIMDNMKASLKADLDVSKMNKHLKAYIQQEIEIGVRTAMENLMKQMIENKTEKLNSEIKTLSGMKNTEITVRLDNSEENKQKKTVQMEQLIKNKSEEMLTLFQDNVERQTIKTDQMELLIKKQN